MGVLSRTVINRDFIVDSANTLIPKGSPSDAWEISDLQKKLCAVVSSNFTWLVSFLSQGLQSESQKLFKIAQELLHTEEAYVKRLNLLDQVHFTYIYTLNTISCFRHYTFFVISCFKPKYIFTSNPCYLTAHIFVITSVKSQINYLHSYTVSKWLKLNYVQSEANLQWLTNGNNIKLEHKEYWAKRLFWLTWFLSLSKQPTGGFSSTLFIHIYSLINSYTNMGFWVSGYLSVVNRTWGFVSLFKY